MTSSIAKTYHWREIARRLARGDRPVDISQAMNIPQSSISVTIKKPFFQQLLAEQVARRDAYLFDLEGQMGEEAGVAFGIVSETMRDEEAPRGVRLSAAKVYTDRYKASIHVDSVTIDNRPKTFEQEVQMLEEDGGTIEDSAKRWVREKKDDGKVLRPNAMGVYSPGAAVPETFKKAAGEDIPDNGDGDRDTAEGGGEALQTDSGQLLHPQPSLGDTPEREVAGDPEVLRGERVESDTGDGC